MDKKKYNSLEELPLFFDVKTAADVLGISVSSVYELSHERGFPKLKISSKLLIPRDKFIKWIESHIEE